MQKSICYSNSVNSRNLALLKECNVTALYLYIYGLYICPFVHIHQPNSISHWHHCIYTETTCFLVNRVTAYLNADAPVAGDSLEHVATVENVYLFRWRI